MFFQRFLPFSEIPEMKAASAARVIAYDLAAAVEQVFVGHQALETDGTASSRVRIESV